MTSINNIINGRLVLFIGGSDVDMSRGWDPVDIHRYLTRLGVEVITEYATSRRHLDELIEGFRGAIIWPICYTISSGGEAASIAESLEAKNAIYVGASSRSVSFSNKLIFKRAIGAAQGLQTPQHLIVDSKLLSSNAVDFAFPSVLKSEYSCNSEGVRLIDRIDDLRPCVEELEDLYGHRIYLERWERSKEYTVAYLPPSQTRKEVYAAVSLETLNGAQYIDAATKADSKLVKLGKLEGPERSEVVSVARSVIDHLDIDGYCRVDLVRNDAGELHLLEINFQPHMYCNSEVMSYFINAIRISSEITFEQQVEQLIENALYRGVV